VRVHTTVVWLMYLCVRWYGVCVSGRECASALQKLAAREGGGEREKRGAPSTEGREGSTRSTPQEEERGCEGLTARLTLHFVCVCVCVWEEAGRGGVGVWFRLGGSCLLAGLAAAERERGNLATVSAEGTQQKMQPKSKHSNSNTHTANHTHREGRKEGAWQKRSER
jgi:hypothetical protein